MHRCLAATRLWPGPSTIHVQVHKQGIICDHLEARGYSSEFTRHGGILKRRDLIRQPVQGSSPAAHDKGEQEPYSSEEEADRPTPIRRIASISNYRPLYSIYIPNSNRPSEVMLIPSAAEMRRTSSLPTNPDALLEEGERLTACTCVVPSQSFQTLSSRRVSGSQHAHP